MRTETRRLRFQFKGRILSTEAPQGGMRTAHVVRHVHFEDLGSFGPMLADCGFRATYAEAGLDDLAKLDPLGPDLLVVLGGPIGVYEEAAYPFITVELDLLARRLAANRPTIGICLGAQLIARALGARVYPSGRKELGWSRLQLTDAGKRSVLQRIGPETTAVLHWHGDTFDLPRGASLLASTDRFEQQAFSRGSNVLALQFHAEATARKLEQWFIGHACELTAAGPAVTLSQLRADTTRFASALEANGPLLLKDWLHQIEW